LRGQARATLGYLVDHLDAPDLRAAFLALPAVRAVWDAG
jgi:hypothetical protein